MMRIGYPSYFICDYSNARTGGYAELEHMHSSLVCPLAGYNDNA